MSRFPDAILIITFRLGRCQSWNEALLWGSAQVIETPYALFSRRACFAGEVTKWKGAYGVVPIGWARRYFNNFRKLVGFLGDFPIYLRAYYVMRRKMFCRRWRASNFSAHRCANRRLSFFCMGANFSYVGALTIHLKLILAKATKYNSPH